jgi:hypothetical protein
MAGASQNSRNGSRFSRMGLYAVVASPCEVTLNWFTPFVLLLRLLVAPRELPSFLDACAALQASTSAMDTSGGAGDESTSLRVCEPAGLRACESASLRLSGVHARLTFSRYPWYVRGDRLWRYSVLRKGQQSETPFLSTPLR